jgi:hypothetical protein
VRPMTREERERCRAWIDRDRRTYLETEIEHHRAQAAWLRKLRHHTDRVAQAPEPSPQRGLERDAVARGLLLAAAAGA